jgi:hypothetical protein
MVRRIAAIAERIAHRFAGSNDKVRAGRTASRLWKRSRRRWCASRVDSDVFGMRALIEDVVQLPASTRNPPDRLRHRDGSIPLQPGLDRRRTPTALAAHFARPLRLLADRQIEIERRIFGSYQAAADASARSRKAALRNPLGSLTAAASSLAAALPAAAPRPPPPRGDRQHGLMIQAAEHVRVLHADSRRAIAAHGVPTRPRLSRVAIVL